MTVTRIVVFAKAPVPGEVKTRLIPALGSEGAADLARAMLLNTLGEAGGAGLGIPELCADPHPRDAKWNGHLPDAVLLTGQGEGDLGQRLERATARVIGAGERILLIGTDCPDLDRHRLRVAAVALDEHDAVIYPALDGGYVLLGLRRHDPSLFSDIPWSTHEVAATTIARIEALGWSLHVGETLRDIDEPADLA
jgi:uncharacterized protein